MALSEATVIHGINSERWEKLRRLEDRNCKDYNKCLFEMAKINCYYVPCFYCNGGKKLNQPFECTNCYTTWIETKNDWVLTLHVTCPFCHHINSVKVTVTKGLKLIGATSLGIPDTETR